MKLCEVLARYRWAERQGLRELSREIGVSPATLSRIERGGVPDGTSLIKILNWLFSGAMERGA